MELLSPPAPDFDEVMDLSAHTASDFGGAMNLYQENQWVLWRDAIPKDICQAYKKHLQQMDAEHKFKPAGIGKGAQKSIIANIRADRILWFSTEELKQWFPEFDQLLNDVMTHMNRRFFLGLRQVEIHGAIYGPNQGYRRHLDQHRDSHQRKATVVFYLNESWVPEHGGELKLFNDQNKASVNIPPLAGHVLLFDSTRFEHQVQTSFENRYSLTGWFRQDGMV